MSVEENVKEIRERVAAAAARAGKDPAEITLVAASKMNPAEKVIEAKNAGITVFGENKVQELLGKKALGAYEGTEVHLIGHLQKNKVRQIVGQCDVIQSVDSPELLQLIAAKAESLGLVQKVLLEVNIGGEESKTGASPDKIRAILDAAAGTKGVSVEGLMTIPPFEENNPGKINYFAKMYQLFVDISAEKYDNVTMRVLSMGMSADFEEAIREGANMVRVGTSIFGARSYQV